MKRLLLVCLLAISLLLMSCGTDDGLPPDPSKPGKTKGAVAGQAYSVGLQKQNYADPTGSFTIDKNEYKFGDTMTATIKGDTYVYNTGYYYDKIGAWKTFKFTGTAVKNWIKGTATASLKIDKDKFPGGTGYMVAYGCKKTGSSWDCHSNKWMAHEFKLPCIADGDCEKGEQCFEGACIDLPEGPTGMPGKCINGTPTGNYLCNESYYGNFQAHKLFYKEDCTTYADKSDWRNMDNCGNKKWGTFAGKTLADACQTDAGCCTQKVVKEWCDKDIWNNKSMDTCTKKENTVAVDCSKIMGTISGKARSCDKRNDVYNCYEKCTPNEKVYLCGEGWTQNYTCAADGFYGDQWSYVAGTECPVGTTCQSGFCT